MKKLIVLFASLAVVAGARAALPAPDLLARIHFAGAQKFSADTNALAFTNEFCSPEALALRGGTADKLAAWLPGWLQKNTGVFVPDGAARLRPLFDDLQSAEWFLEARTAANGKAAVALAVKLADSRAQIWRTNLKPLFPAATFKTVGGWLIFETGTAPVNLGDRLAQEISAPPGGWLAADVNWPALARWFPKLKELALPETQLKVQGIDAELHIGGKFLFPENLSLTLEPWRVPTNTLHQPFISFTAARGFSSWLRAQTWAEPYALSPTPNAIFFWALPSVPFQTFAAIPVPNAGAALQQAYVRLKPQIESGAPGAVMMPFTLELTNNEISLGGVPFASPYLQAKSEPAGQFLLAGAFPNTPRSKPLPAELFALLAEKNLLFYHWEITAERMPQVLNLAQLSLLLTAHKQLNADSAAAKWILNLTPKLGNTVTTVTQSGPAEMTFTRRAPGGLTALEFFALASWLDANNFPGWDLKLPPRPANFRRPHPQAPRVISVPAPTH